MDKKIEKIKYSLAAAEYLFVGIFAFVLIAVSIMMMVYIPSVGNLMNGYAENAVLNAAMGNSNAAESFFNAGMSALESYEADFLSLDITDKDAVRALCIGIVESTGFQHVGFTPVDGVTISSTGKEANTSNRVFIRKGLAGEASVYANMFCDFDGQAMDAYSIPVRDSTGAVIGVLTGECAPFNISSVSLLDIAGDKNCFFVLDTEGVVVYASTGNKAGISVKDDFLRLIADESVSKDIQFILNSVTNTALKTITIGDTEYFAAFSPMYDREWTFAAIVPKSDVLSSFNTVIVFTVAMAGIMTLLLIVCALVIAVRIKRIKDDIEDAIETSFSNLYVDSITGHDTIPKFRENYQAAMKDTATGHALISLDVDRFKAVNDTLGYEGGNDVIRQLSDILKRNMKETDFFARSSGDQFYILACFSERTDIVELAENIISDVAYQITVMKLAISIGIYVIDDPSVKSRVAADRADMAREATKGRKESMYVFFDNSMLQKIRREKKIEDIMEDALALGEFLVYLQPKFGLGENNEVCGAEALVRWMHEGKLIPPGEFIPLFEKNGFVNKIDYFIFEEVCKLQKKYEKMGYEPKIVSVNMSRTHIHQPGFVGELAEMCAKYELDTKYIEIEITESAAFEDMYILCDIFREIKSHGFHVSIDDFGTGYSSLNMLKDLPVDVLKIDRSFLTENADEHENASVIIGSVVSLAAALGIRTICEGIETKEQAALLTKLGCNMAQGFLFARPMPVSDYEKLTYGLQ